MAKKPDPIRFADPPGTFIREELKAREWAQGYLAIKMGRPLQTVNLIINGHKAITAETAIELGTAFGTSAVYWMNLQSAYELYIAAQKKRKAVTVQK